MRGTIYQRSSDNLWVGSIDIENDELRKRKRKVIYGKTKKQVEEKINKILFELQTGTYIEKNSKTLIKFLYDYYEISLPHWEQTTAALYKMYIDVHFEPYFKKIKLTDVKPITLDKFYNYKLTTARTQIISNNKKVITKLVDPLNINSVIKLNVFLKSAFNYAIKNGFIISNPADAVLLAKKERYRPAVYNESKFMALLNTVENTDDEVPILLGAGCGLRRGEVFGLRWRNINLDNKTLTVSETVVHFNKNITKQPKTDSSTRTISIPEHVVLVLKKYKESTNGKDDEYIIKRWIPQSYSEHFKTLLKAHELDHIRFHDLRHYNAIIMLKNGISDKVAAERLGHSNVSTLREVYQHVLVDMDENAAIQLNSMFQKM